MKHKVNVTGILKANGQMAYYGEVLDENELVNPDTSIKDGYTVAAKGSDKAADKPAPAAAAPAIDAAAQQSAIDAAVAKALADKQAADDAQKAIDDEAAAKAQEDQNAANAADLLANAKSKTS